jgi:hypothetical protein
MPLRKVGLLILVAAALLAGAASCVKPPDDQARKARSALSDLQDVVKAQKWAPDELGAAAAALGEAEKEVRSQNTRIFLMRDYTKATELYARAMEDAVLAREAASAGKQRAEKNAREALDAALAAIVHAQAALTIAPVSRDSRSSFDLLDQQLDRAASRLDDVRNLIVAEEYKDAADRAEEIRDQVTSMLRNVSRNARH